MTTVIVKVSGGRVDEVLMDEKDIDVYVLDFDNEGDFEGEKFIEIDGDTCVNAYYADIVDPDKVNEIVQLIKRVAGE